MFFLQFIVNFQYNFIRLKIIYYLYNNYASICDIICRYGKNLLYSF